jgi:hypothetical protein
MQVLWGQDTGQAIQKRIKYIAFFKTTNYEALLEKRVEPPFEPVIKEESTWVRHSFPSEKPAKFFKLVHQDRGQHLHHMVIQMTKTSLTPRIEEHC